MAKSKCGLTGKVKFNTPLDAALAIARIQGVNNHHRHRKQREEPTQSRYCKSCRSWHLTR